MDDDLIHRRELAGIDFANVAAGQMIPRVIPGEILRKEFLIPLGLSARGLSHAVDVPADRITARSSESRLATQPNSR